MARYTIGLDYGTNSVRALLVEVETGNEIATSVFDYPHGTAGIVLDPRDPDLARQHPRDYLDGAAAVIKGALRQAAERPGFLPDQVIGIGVDTTGSTPIPVNADGTPLAMLPEFADNPAAMAYLWKDHTGHAEAAEITALAAKTRPHYLAKCGGTYSAEWLWSKILHCARTSPEVFAAAYTWVEHADWLPAALCCDTRPAKIKRCICAAGHKGMYHRAWGGYPDEEFLAQLDPRLVALRRTLPDEVYHIGEIAGTLSEAWAASLGLPAGIPISVGAFDAHLGGVGSGIAPGVLVKIMGTSTCDLLVDTLEKELPDIPGLCGIVPESILPGMYGLEAGQSAVGDIFNWFVNAVQPAGLGHQQLTEQAARMQPGESGLLALDWHNGNRTVLIDQRLTGGVIGLTLQTTPAELYRAWVEATAFGARVIMERFTEYGIAVDQVMTCGGISAKNALVMQIYADVMGRPLAVSRSAQTCALGAAISGAVAAGAYASFADARVMTGEPETVFTPNPEHQRVYDRLYKLYRQLHDAFGVTGTQESLANVMKDLLAIRDEVRRGVVHV